MDAALALRGQGRPCLRRASLSSIFLFLFGKCPDSFSLFPSQNVPPGSIGSYVAEEGPIEFSNWNGISFEEGLRWILSIFREFGGKRRGWVCSWRAINQSDSDNWWNNGAIDNDTREKIVFVGWNWVPTSFRDSI